jgi:hypothetical protein
LWIFIKVRFCILFIDILFIDELHSFDHICTTIYIDDWNKFLELTGRDTMMKTKQKSLQDSNSIRKEVVRVNKLSDEERLRLALKVARRFKHVHTEDILLSKLKELGLEENDD